MGSSAGLSRGRRLRFFSNVFKFSVSSDVLLNRCVPKDITELSKDTIEKLISFLNSSRLISKVMADLYMARWAILGMCGIALREYTVPLTFR